MFFLIYDSFIETNEPRMHKQYTYFECVTRVNITKIITTKQCQSESKGSTRPLLLLGILLKHMDHAPN